jgi:tRNA pseudouridine55 synthase
MEPLILRKGMTLTDSIEDYPSGIIIPIDKPWRWTSADVIRKVKWAAGKHFHQKKLKVGHAGTLDPLATGVLLVCIGKATKLADELQRHEKEYLAGVVLGATTPSYDREKEVDRRCSLEGVSEDALRAVLPSFLGEQEQVAPLFSAKSVDGVRAYEMARKAYKAAQRGEGAFDHSATELLTRQRICIPEIELVAYGDCRLCEGNECRGVEARVNPKINVISLEGLDLPCALIRVACTKGTYIRALARDIGEALGSGAFLGSLRRTRTGGFRVGDALSLSDALSSLLK